MARATYHQALDQLIDQLVSMTETVRIALRDATQALLDPDLGRAERVISDDAIIDVQADQAERQCLTLLARQAPVAGELRTILAAFRMISELSRMGDLSAHVAKIARMRYPESAAPESLRESFATMGRVADDMIVSATQTLANRDVEQAERLAESDREMDDLRRQQFQVLLGDDWDEGVEKAVDAALLGRYYERIADHAVSIGGKIIFLVTGEAPEGDEWPRW